MPRINVLPATAAEMMEHFGDWFVPITETGCWIWMKSLNGGGYADMRVDGRHYLMARHAYELCNGKIPRSLHTDHLCRVRCCINPDHLEAVTPRINLLRGDNHAARAARRDRCVRGHPYTPDNTFVRVSRGRKYRVCRECTNGRHRAMSPIKYWANPEANRARARECYHRTDYYNRVVKPRRECGGRA